MKAGLFADIDGQEWRAYAECARPEHADVVFVADGRGGNRNTYDAALAICATCAVRAECLDDALRYEARDRLAVVGVRGGLRPGEREAILNRRQRAAA